MVICQFFLKGACKFGNRCNNEHTYPNSGGGFVGRPTFGQQSLNDRYHFTAVNTANKGFGNQAAKTNNNFPVDQNAILQALRKELQEWDINKVWPLSCFAAQREQKCLAGLEDTSPEELRLEAYKYQGTGNFQSYVNGISTLSNQVMIRRNQLKTMSNDQLLKELQSSNNSNVAAVSKASSSTSLFGSSTFGNSNNLFGGSGFGNSSQSQTTSTTSSIFGSGNQPGGLFTGGVKSTLSNPFLSSTSGGLSSNTGGLFMNTSGSSTVNIGNAAASGNPFFANHSAAQGGLFSSNTSTITAATSTKSSLLPKPFGNTASNVNPFGGPAAVSSSGVIASNVNPFGGPAAVSSSGALFSQLKPSGLFGTSPTAPSAVGVSTAPANPFFSPTATIQSPVQLKAPVVTSNTAAYISKLPQVTAADIEKFKAAKFILGQIPMCPPPIELC